VVPGLVPHIFTIEVLGTAPQPGGPGGVSIVSGNGQVVLQSLIASRPLVVSVKDSNGVPLPGVEVVWTVTAGTGPTLSATSTITDLSGQTSILVRGSNLVPSNVLVPYVQSTINASTATTSVDFFLTTLGNSVGGQPALFTGQLVRPSDGVISGQAGQTLTGAVQVRTMASFVALPNIGVEVSTGNDAGAAPTAACSSGLVLTGTQGIASCDLVLGRRAGETQLVAAIGGIKSESMTLRVTPGPAGVIKVIQGDAQSGGVGQMVPLALVAQVTDAFDNPIANAPVQWEVTPVGAVALTPPTHSVTDGTGRVSTLVKFGSVPGTFQVRLRAGAVLTEWNLTARLVLSGLTVLSGSGQTTLTGKPFPEPLRVQVKDDKGVPVAGATVEFVVTSGTAIPHSPVAVTDSEGIASTLIEAGPGAGPITAVASAANLPPAIFQLIVKQGSPVVAVDNFVNAAGFQPGAVPGGLVTILAPGLAPGLDGCLSSGMTGTPLPLTLGGLSVQFGRLSAPVLSVCNSGGREQVTVQAPFELAPGTVQATVTNNGGSAEVNGIPVLTAQPGIFESAASDGRPHAAVQRADGSFSSPENPVAPGEIVRVYVTGLGPVLPRAATNQPGVRGQAVFLPVIVGVNHAGTRVVSADYAENMIGVYLVAFEIPREASKGREIPLSVAVETALDGRTVYSNPSRIAIQ
jgi:uncharacterized protein (TIGR03437 family)